MKFGTLLVALAMFMPLSSLAAVSILEEGGWFESGYVLFGKDGSASYNAYYKSEADGEYVRIDGPLVRDYGDYGRVDVIGIKAGDYRLKVVPVDENGAEKADGAAESGVFTVKAHDRSGFAHFNYTKGIGAYNDDGTLKAGAKVVYITAGNAKTVTCEINGQTATGFQAIVDICNGKYGTTPVAFRIIGTVRLEDMDEIGSSSEGLQIKGRSGYQEMDITLEGVGNDAVLHGLGILVRNCTSVELRNFAVMNCLDDCISLDTDNSHCWIHNIDFFYGKDKGGDQAKGDGSMDLKGDSQYLTISYNHFWDSGKSSLCGMKSESGPNWISYHHNWFDHSDSRHPRVRTMSVHVYNNYFDGIAKYGVGATTGASVFVENNYYRNINRPMMSSRQGTDATGDGTFSGEDGGVIKSYGNYFGKGSAFSYITYQDNSTSFDAYEAASRDEQVPATVKALVGGTAYDNFDTNSSRMYAYVPDAAADVPAIVEGPFGAGRMQHGDFEFAFDDAVDDASYEINTALKAKMLAYQSALVGILGDSTIGGGGTEDPDPQPDPDDPQPDPASGYACWFTGGTPSNAFYTITGNYSNSKGTAVVNGTTYEYCLKMESSTSVRFTIAEPMTLMLVFGSDETASLKLDGTKTTASSNVFTQRIEAGSHEITKSDVRNLFYIDLIPENVVSITVPVWEGHDDDGPLYDLSGRLVNRPQKGIYIRNGKKVVIR